MNLRMGTVTPAVVRLLAVGDANADLVLPHLSRIPRFGREVIVPTMELQAGGSAANFALCAASLGTKTGFAGRLGVDRFGELVLRAFRQVNVDTQFLRLVERRGTGITVALIREDGDRAFVTYQGTNAETVLEDLKVSLDVAPPPRWLHLAGYFLLPKLRGKPAQTLLHEARKRGITTSLDTGWDPDGWSSDTISSLNRVLQYVDIFFPNSNELKAITGERSLRKGAEHLLKLGVSTVVIKRGARGCLLVTAGDQRRFPAFEVEVVDTTAAGDAFDAGFVVSMLSGATLCV